MVDHETIIETGDGGAAAIVAGLLIVVVLVVGFFFYFGSTGARGTVIDIDVPRVTINVQPDGQ
ncbi:MAG: hypothetical protein ABIQ30_09695 [Devosia sp.]